ncbi:MAG: hypothetical protein PHF00_06275, partial [Elusimicrobia bacterium]|nr:hypothetical protein [Elusimicrobiota bacterium]
METWRLGPGPRKTLQAFLVLLLYAALAAAYCRPLASNFFTRYLGSADFSPSVWNLWHFRYSLDVLHANPLWNDFQYWPYGSNLILHHHIVFYDAVAYFLIPRLGLVGSYNFLCVLSMALAGLGVFLMARDWDAGPAAAFVAGAAFAFSPAEARFLESGCLDCISIQTLPFFLWTFSRAVRGGRLLDAFWAALCLTWVWTFNYHFFLFCCLLIPAFHAWLHRPLRLDVLAREPFRGGRILARLLEAALAADAVWLALRLKSAGQRQFHGRGSAVELALYVAPYLLFWGLLAARLLLRRRLAVSWNGRAWRWPACRPYAATIGFWVLLNIPLIVMILELARGKGLASPQNPWRGGGNPTDLATLLLPNRFHPLWGEWIAAAYTRLFNPGTLLFSLGWGPLAVLAWLWRRPRDRWTSLWFFGFIFSLVLTMGSWLKVFGFHTYLPLPFYFLHLLPIFNSVQTTFNMGIFIVLFTALLLAAALTAMQERLPANRARWVAPAAFCLLAFEFAPRPFAMARVDEPPLLRRLADRPFAAVLPIPMGATFNGLSGQGMLGTHGIGPELQPLFRKPMVGGYLTRVP